MAETDKSKQTSMHVMSGVKSQHDGMGHTSAVKKFTKKKPLID